MKLLSMLLACAALPATAATLKPFTTLSGPVVTLADLFDGADSRARGPAPAPGARITVEARQLEAIARQYGVDWRPMGAGDRAVLGVAATRVTRIAQPNSVLAGSAPPEIGAAEG